MFQRALKNGGFPETIWDVSKTPPLDPSYVDPIWDGSPTFAVRHTHLHTGNTSSNAGNKGHTARNSSETGNTNRNSGKIGSVVRSSARFMNSSITGGEYANFPMNVFASRQSEEHPIMDNDELTRRVTLAVPLSHDMTRVPSTFGGNRRRSDIAYAQYRDNPMTVLWCVNINLSSVVIKKTLRFGSFHYGINNNRDCLHAAVFDDMSWVLNKKMPSYVTECNFHHHWEEAVTLTYNNGIHLWPCITLTNLIFLSTVNPNNQHINFV